MRRNRGNWCDPQCFKAEMKFRKKHQAFSEAEVETLLCERRARSLAAFMKRKLGRAA